MAKITIIVNLIVIEKNLFARGTLLAPMQFPTIPQIASCIPRGIMKINELMLTQITIEAYSLTPIMPASKTITSNAHHSAQIITVVGRDTWKYYFQPLKVSTLLNGTKASLIYFEQEPYIVTVSRSTPSLIDVAMAKPMIPISR